MCKELSALAPGWWQTLLPHGTGAGLTLGSCSGLSGAYSPASPSKSSTAALSSSGLFCSPLTEIRAASKSLQHCLGTQHEGQKHLLVALEAFCLKMVGRFPCISDEGCPSCYWLCWPLASALPSSQPCFPHSQLPNGSPSCKAKKALHFYMDNQ